MEFKKVTVNRTNLLDLDCLYKQILELSDVFKHHKHPLSDIVGFPTLTGNEGKSLSIVGGVLAWVDKYALKTTSITATGDGLIGGGTLAADRTISLDFSYLDTRYTVVDAYTKSEINNFFAGSPAITGYNKTHWDSVYNWQQNISGQALLGRYSNSVGPAQSITLGPGLILDVSTGVLTAIGAVSSIIAGSAITIDQSTGDVTVSISDHAITYAKIQNVTGSTILGRYSSTIGTAQEITIGANLVLDNSTGVLSALVPVGDPALRSGQQYIATAGQTVFTVTGGYGTGLIDVFINGAKLAIDKYIAIDGINVTLLTPREAGDVVEFIAYRGAGTLFVSTDYVPEGSLNLYYTDARVLAYGNTQWAKIDGSNATGTWGISISGTAAKWNNEIYNGVYSSGTLTYLMSYNNTTASWNAVTPSTVQSFLGLGSMAYEATSSYYTKTAADAKYLTGLTGDGTTSGVGNAAFTLSTVNSNVGTFGSSSAVPVITVDAKGRITAVSTSAISSTIAFNGDASGSGTTGTTTTLTLATVNSNVGSFGSSSAIPVVTVDGKGRITAISTVSVAIPSGALSFTGDVTGSGTTGSTTTLTLVNSAVTGQALTGLNLSSGTTITSSDTILSAFGKVQNQISALVGGVTYKGTWNASTNTPTLTSSTGTKGWYYIVTTAGSTNLDGITDWKIGDWAIYDGTQWDKVDNTDAVSSVNGFTGAVSLTTTNISESGNLYFTNARAIAAALTGYTSGAGTITSSDSILSAIQKLNGNITALTTGVSSVFGRTGAVTAQSGDYTTAQVTEVTNLYYTDARARASISLTVTGNSGASTYNSTTGVLNIPTYTLTGLGGITLTSLSSSATGLTYTNTTGVFSLTSGYVIPTTTEETNWNTAYTNRITSLTVTGSSGSATLSSNTLNIPTYTLSGLGGQPLSTNLTSLSGLSYVSTAFVKMTASGTFSLDTNTYLTGNQTITLSGDVTGSGTTAITTTIGANKVLNSMLAGSIAASKLVGTDITTVGTITTGTWNGTAINLSSYASGTLQAAQFPALTGDVTTTAGSLSTTIASNAVTLAKFQQVATQTLLGRGTAGTGNIEVLSLGAPFSITGGALTLSSSAVRNYNNFTATAGQTVFTVTGGYVPGLIDVFVNGVKLIPTTEFTATNGTSITLISAAALNDVVETIDWRNTNSNWGTFRSVFNYTATASQTTFTPTGGYTVGMVEVYYNGARLVESDFTATNGTTIVLGTGAPVNTLITIIVYGNIGSGYIVNTDQITEGSTNLYFTNARAIASTLTGYTSGSGSITSSDTILSAIQKLNGNDGLKLALAGGTMTGNLIMTTGGNLSLGYSSDQGKRLAVNGSTVLDGTLTTTNQVNTLYSSEKALYTSMSQNVNNTLFTVTGATNGVMRVIIEYISTKNNSGTVTYQSGRYICFYQNNVGQFSAYANETLGTSFITWNVSLSTNVLTVQANPGTCNNGGGFNAKITVISDNSSSTITIT